MNTEPSVLYQIFDILLQIIVFVVIMGGALLLFVLIDRFFKKNSHGPTWHERHCYERYLRGNIALMESKNKKK